MLLALVCLALGRNAAARLPWAWLGMFGLLGGLGQWLSTLGTLVTDPSFIIQLRICAQMASLLCLAEFGRAGTRSVTGRGPGRWILLVPLLLGCAGLRLGAGEAALRYSLGIVGSIWTCAALIQAAMLLPAGGLRRHTNAVGWLFGVYAATVGLVVPQADFFPASVINEESFLHLFGFPAQAAEAVVVLAAASAVWYNLKSARSHERRTYGFVLLALVTATVVCGWQFTEQTSSSTRRECLSRLLAVSRIAAASIDPYQVRGLGSAEDVNKPRFQSLHKRLMAMRKGNPEFRWLYLTVRRDHNIAFIADSLPLNSKDCAPPGAVYTEAPVELRKVMAGGRGETLSQYSDRWGRFYSAFVPIRDETTGSIVAVLGVDIDQKAIDGVVSKERLQPTFITLLAVLLLILLFVTYERHKESFDRVCASQRALAESHDRFEQIAAEATEMIWEVDPTGLYTYVSSVAKLITGYEPEELVGKMHFYDLRPEALREQMRLTVAEVIDRRESFRDLLSFIETKDGRIVQVSTNGLPVIDEDGKLIGYRGANTDITVREQAERALRESEEKFRSIVESSPTGMYFYELDHEGQLILRGANPAADRIVGLPHQPLLGKTVEEAFPRLVGTGIPELYKRVASGDIGPQMLEMTYEDGPIAGCYEVHVFRTGEGAVAVDFVDITERKESDEALKQSEFRYRALFESAQDAIFVVQGGTILDCNPRSLEMFGCTAEEIIGKTSMDFSPKTQPDGRNSAKEAFGMIRLAISGIPQSFAWRHHRMDGTEFDTEVSLSRVEIGGAESILAIVRDVTERKRAEAQIQLHSAALNAADDLIAILDRQGEVVYANQAFQRQTGFSPEEIIGRDLSVLWLAAQNENSIEQVCEAIRAGAAWSGEMVCGSKNGWSYTADVSITPLIREGDVRHLVAIARNVTERKVYEDLLDHQAHHDALTELPNRLLFSEALGSTLADHGTMQAKCAVFFVDLDRFKLVNDTMGHQAGDKLLYEVATRLRSCLRDDDILARMGGDEFTVLVSHIRGAADATIVADRMLDLLSQPFEINGVRFVISASIGVSFFPDNAGDVDGLLKAADSAMYKAKEAGRNNCQFYSDELSHANNARVRTERELRQALGRNELKVYYQPIVEVSTMRLAGAEALLRWDHPENGIISPAVFVPIAEETGMILDIGRDVLNNACETAKGWLDRGLGDLEISVNVSPIQLRCEGFVSEIEAILRRTGLPPRLLNLEITETVLARNDYGETDTLARLMSTGVRTCLDDFGVGYSTLSRLKDFPIAHMKVDGSFIRDIENDRKDRAMTESIITLAHNLGIRVTAEWIENEEQLTTIGLLGCDFAQGYLMSPALSPSAFEVFARNWRDRGAGQTAA